MLDYGTVQGYQALWLDNGDMRVGVLPQKGADIFSLQYKPEGIQFLLQTPWGLKPNSSKPQQDFLENYEGGWQELFPNPGDPYSDGNVNLPFHGEAALLPWEWFIETDDARETRIRFQVRCVQTPFLVERWMSLKEGINQLTVRGRVTNLSSVPLSFLWGNHIVLGGSFLDEGCILDVPAGLITTPKVLYEPETARLAPGQRSEWPFAIGRKENELIDMRRIPGRAQHSHDDVVLEELHEGKLTVMNPALKLSFWMEWDADVFRCIQLWQPLGGADIPPLTGIYGLGVEPWMSPLSLGDAIQQGEARILNGGESMQTELTVGVNSIGQ